MGGRGKIRNCTAEFIGRFYEILNKDLSHPTPNFNGSLAAKDDYALTMKSLAIYELGVEKDKTKALKTIAIGFDHAIDKNIAGQLNALKDMVKKRTFDTWFQNKKPHRKQRGIFKIAV